MRLAEIGHGPADFVEDVAFAGPDGVEQQERDRLEMDDPTSIGRIVRYTADTEGRPIEVTDLRFVADAFRFRWAWSILQGASCCSCRAPACVRPRA